jgi:guanosine-3',5'-bis(diphosphate) 3'-pyrophosphohydrolase
VRSLVEWQREMSDPNEFLSTLKIDLYPEEVYTFTPKGKVVVLPKDASPVDFAYSVHTEVGQTCTGARVNGRMVPLRTRLRNGDIVEIVTQNGHTPSRDWLTFVKSSRARNKIKHWLNEHQRERAIDIGSKLLDREARKYKVSLARFNEVDYTRVANDYGVGGEKDLLAGIGFGKYSSRQVLHKLEPALIAPVTPDADTADGRPTADTVKKLHLNPRTEALEVEGQNDLLVYRARCCNPIRGEEIIGYVTRGRGVAVHARRTCCTRPTAASLWSGQRMQATNAEGSKPTRSG